MTKEIHLPKDKEARRSVLIAIEDHIGVITKATDTIATVETYKSKCYKDHDCEACLREDVKAKELELADLKKKLPQQITINNFCNGHCNSLHCQQWGHSIPYRPYPQYFSNGITNAIGYMSTQATASTTLNNQLSNPNDNTASGTL